MVDRYGLIQPTNGPSVVVDLVLVAVGAMEGAVMVVEEQVVMEAAVMVVVLAVMEVAVMEVVLVVMEVAAGVTVPEVAAMV